MSLHPLKRSDQNKSWNKGRNNKKIKIQPEYQLIITEGEKTEPKYFSAIAKLVNMKYPQKINVKVEGKGNNTLNLFEKAKRTSESSLNEIKHVWLVYDTDDFPAEHINKTAQLCELHSTEQIQYHAIWSNQCIELWFLLHFGYYQSDNHRSEYYPKLTEWFSCLGYGVYTKNRSDMFEILKPYLDDAIKNAERLEDENKEKTPAASAPGTMVHHLIKYLRPYFDDDIQTE